MKDRMMRELLKANQVDACFVDAFDFLPFILQHTHSRTTSESVYGFLKDYLFPSKHVCVFRLCHKQTLPWSTYIPIPAGVVTRIKSAWEMGTKEATGFVASFHAEAKQVQQPSSIEA